MIPEVLTARSTGDLSWLADRTIYLTRHGSHAYGTSLPTSDVDYRGIAIPPAPYIFGALKRFEQAESRDPDMTVFDLRKFIMLASQANPNVIEILYTDPSDHLLISTMGEVLLDHRNLFLSRRAKHTFSGYAHSQLKRIKRHYRWLKMPPKAPPTRAEYSLPERTLIPADQLAAARAAIRARLDEWSATFLDDLSRDVREGVLHRMSEHLAEIQVSMDENAWIGAARTVGFDENFIALLDRERRYDAAKKEWDSYQTWQRERNADRASLEAKFGYDTKHAMHLVRLMRMCREILTSGRVLVRRPDAEELLQIRAGAWTLERLIDWAESEDKALDEVAKLSPLPSGPDAKAIDALCVRMVREAVI